MTLIRILHGLTVFDRQTTIDNCLSFSRHAGDVDVECVNIHTSRADSRLYERADLTLVTYEVMSQRNISLWPDIVLRARAWFALSHRNIVFPQDDFSTTELIEEFAIRERVNAVYTAVQTDLDILYPQISGKIRLESCLTGYVEHADKREEHHRVPLAQRPVDVANRIRRLPRYFGEKSILKADASAYFSDLARNAGFIVDVSDRPEDALLGASWGELLATSKFTVGAKGGASIADPRGRVAQRYYRELARGKSEELAFKSAMRERHIEGDFSAVGPRLFEAAKYGLCQILVRENFVNGFEPWVHYVPLEPDFSNANAIVSFLTNIDKAQEIANSAYDLLVASDDFSYRRFVSEVLHREVAIQSGSHERRFVGLNAMDSIAAQGADTAQEVLAMVRRSIIRGELVQLRRELDAKILPQAIGANALKWLESNENSHETLSELVGAATTGELSLYGLHVPCVSASHHFENTN